MQTLTTKLPKVYVAVRAEFDEYGVMYPREITWEDGEKKKKKKNYSMWQWVMACPRVGMICPGDGAHSIFFAFRLIY